METIAIIISVIALIVGIISYIKAIKKQTVEIKEVFKETEPQSTTIEHPFIYDESKTSYTLDGNLEVTGGISCLIFKEK